MPARLLFYWLICRPSKADEAKIGCFRQWIVQEMLLTASAADSGAAPQRERKVRVANA